MKIVPVADRTPTLEAETPATPAMNPHTGVAIPALPAGDETATILYYVARGDSVVIVPSPPGAGKSYRSVIIAAHLAAMGLRVCVSTSTKMQGYDFANRLVRSGTAVKATWLVSASGKADAKANLDAEVKIERSAQALDADDTGITVMTSAKLAWVKPDDHTFDVVIVDEAYQLAYHDLLRITPALGTTRDGGSAGTMLLVGDPGQLPPVVTVPTDTWDRSLYAPHRPSPEVLMATRPDDISIVRLSSTRRLGPATTELIQPLYPFSFGSSRPHSAWRDANGTPAAEFTSVTSTTAGGQADPSIADAIAAQVEELVTGTIEDHTGVRPVGYSDIAVCCAHVTQTNAVQARVHPDVLVATADRLQGLEKDCVIVWDPLAGQAGCPEFNLSTGRLCVSLSRHRSHLRWVTTKEVAPALLASDHTDATVNLSIRRQLAA